MGRLCGRCGASRADNRRARPKPRAPRSVLTSPEIAPTPRDRRALRTSWPVVVALKADDLAVAQRRHQCVGTLELQAATQSPSLHANEHDDCVTWPRAAAPARCSNQPRPPNREPALARSPRSAWTSALTSSHLRRGHQASIPASDAAPPAWASCPARDRKLSSRRQPGRAGTSTRNRSSAAGRPLARHGYYRFMQLQRCRVLVTGASEGIGGAIGRELRREGCALGAVAPALVGAL